jgi:hypothetical protein
MKHDGYIAIIGILIIIMSMYYRSNTDSNRSTQYELKHKRDSIDVLIKYTELLYDDINNCKDSLTITTYQVDLLNTEVSRLHGR